MTPTVLVILITCVSVFFLQTFLAWYQTTWLNYVFGLSVAGIKMGHLWQFVTYIFLHGSVLHLFVNMLGLYFLGPELERTLGRSRFLALFGVSGILGGIGWLILTYPYEGICIGASGSLFGLIGAFAALFPNRTITLLVFFVLPVSMKAWVLAVCLGVFELLMVLNPVHGGIAYAAHLAGGIAGYMYALTLKKGTMNMYGSIAGRFRERRERAAFERDASNRAEMDRILDKIARDGIHHLTPAEREFLDRESRSRKGR